jgi:thiol-disulfide isomerase/thioredoxin
MALTFTPNATGSETCPEFSLLSLDGKTYQKKDFANGNPVVFMFICNHCPYVKAIEERLIQLGHDLKKLNVHLVAICSNDANEYPEDSFENLKKNALDKKFPFVYLHDPTQNVAHAFQAVCTPDFFVYDSQFRLAYRGRLDDSWKDANKVTKRELYQAVLDLTSGKQLSKEQMPSMGCSIKWL